jgi:hypothetical protein
MASGPVAPISPKPGFKPVMSREDAERIVDGLLGLGYLNYVPEAERAEVREQLVDSAHLGLFAADWYEFETPDGSEGQATRDRRTFWTDAENLADGCVASYLKEMKPTLFIESVRLEIAEDRWIKTGIDNEHWKGKRYEALINDRTYIVYDSSNARVDLDTWGLGHKRLVEIINDLLIDAGSSVRAYGVGSCNDAQVMLLAPEQYEYLRNYQESFQRGFFPVPVEEMKLVHQDYWPGGKWSGVPPDGKHD